MAETYYLKALELSPEDKLLHKNIEMVQMAARKMETRNNILDNTHSVETQKGKERKRANAGQIEQLSKEL